MIVNLLIILIVVGGLLYIAQLLPIDATVKKIATVVVILALAVYVLKNLGALGL